ncbi:GAF domain-containing sensor histidine kinase [Actinoplanes sp. NPDC051851]|uniref:sensor histidine kinase n=1 Tax=Actinoplanes sp. NPDC051851 TaxID=3154753 RepID=UPI003430C464
MTIIDEPEGRVLHGFARDMTVDQRVRRFAAVEAAISRGLVEADSSADAAARVTEALGSRMGWPVTELWLTDARHQVAGEQQRVLTCAARYAPGMELGDFAAEELTVGPTTVPGRVVAQARTIWVPHLAADTASPRSRAADRIGLHVAVGVPVASGGRPIGVLCVYGDRIEDPDKTLTALLTNITAQVGQYLERRRAEELAVELARTKDEFLALVTHELRNPLSVISAEATMLEEEIDEIGPDEQRRRIRTIIRNADHLRVVSDDLLDLARLESGQLSLEPRRTDLCQIIRESMQAVRAAAGDKNLTVDAALPGTVRLQGDPNRLRQVADNLLSNAVKYTPAGGAVTIRVDAGSDEVVWRVADTGIGIPEAERPQLFRRFFRASSAVDRRIPGTGLGLVITRAIVERHEGTIGLADGETGTTFVIRLPRRLTEQAPAR